MFVKSKFPYHIIGIGNENCIEELYDNDDMIEKNVESATKYRWPNKIIFYKIGDNIYSDKEM